MSNHPTLEFYFSDFFPSTLNYALPLQIFFFSPLPCFHSSQIALGFGHVFWKESCECLVFFKNKTQKQPSGFIKDPRSYMVCFGFSKGYGYFFKVISKEIKINVGRFLNRNAFLL